MMNMACTLFRMTPEEAWRGFTVNAAGAGLPPTYGMLGAGSRADFAVWDAEHPVTWSIASAIIHCNN